MEWSGERVRVLEGLEVRAVQRSLRVQSTVFERLEGSLVCRLSDPKLDTRGSRLWSPWMGQW